MLMQIIPSHDIAQFILRLIRMTIDKLGLKDTSALEQTIYVVAITIVAIALGYVLRLITIFIARRIISIRKSDFAKELLNQKVATKCSHIIPPLVLLALLPFAFSSGSHTLLIIRQIVFIYLIIMFGVGLSSVIKVIYTNYNQHLNKDNHPLKGVLDVALGIVWMIIVIICASILIHKSPMALLGGLGAFAAALMLIFKDSILGFVAGIQLSANDMLRVGDWIVVPSTIANGIVVDVSLTVVKVQNWDNTMVMLPPYTLVSGAFQNWRGMSDSGIRQIDRSFYLDSASIRVADSDFLARISAKYPEMKDYIANRQQLATEGKAMVFNGGLTPVNGTIDTNIGLYRAYMCKYLLAHPAISQKDNIIVRLIENTPEGTKLDIYCFTNTTDWLAYEAIRSQVMEHVITTSADFGLRIFNFTDHGQLAMSEAAEANLTAKAS